MATSSLSGFASGGMDRLSTVGIGTPLLLLVIMAMMVVPLPAFLLDVLFTFNISLALVVLLAGIYARRPLAFQTC